MRIVKKTIYAVGGTLRLDPWDTTLDTAREVCLAPLLRSLAALPRNGTARGT